jgi:hypothetical protein
MAEIWFTHPLGYGVCFIKFETKEQILKGIFTGQDNATVGFFRIKMMDNRKGEIIN